MVQTTFDFGSVTAMERGVRTTTSQPLRIPGLHYIAGFLSQDEQFRLIEHVRGEPWLDDLDRRVQHYGWRYDYRAKSISADMRIGPLPAWLQRVGQRLFERTGLFESVPNQAIINEYEPGQGIAMHVDRHCFGPTVATVSVGDDWMMDFRPVGTKNKNAQILLERGSALVLTGVARNRWLHGIAKRKSETDTYGRRPRQRRISLTFRTVVPVHTRPQ